jgi:hypothetical protein
MVASGPTPSCLLNDIQARFGYQAEALARLLVLNCDYEAVRRLMMLAIFVMVFLVWVLMSGSRLVTGLTPSSGNVRCSWETTWGISISEELRRRFLGAKYCQKVQILSICEIKVRGYSP